MTTLALYELLKGDVISYQQLIEGLASYKKPRDKISRMLSSGDLIRIRKGLYIFGNQFRKFPIDRFYLANLIYGPSYVSFETALAHYGLIPERVETITSTTIGRNKKFKTPLGLFTYQARPSFYYQEGVILLERSSGNILIATPEKALCDQLLLDGTSKIKTLLDLEKYFLDDLRVNLEQLHELKLKRLKKIVVASKSPLLNLFVSYLKK